MEEEEQEQEEEEEQDQEEEQEQEGEELVTARMLIRNLVGKTESHHFWPGRCCCQMSHVAARTRGVNK